MDQPTHIFDPDGEVIITLQGPAHTFAPWNADGKTPAKEGSVEGAPVEEAPAGVILDDQHEEEHVKEQSYRIQASAKHLIFASPVFKKALTGRWNEGFQLFKTGVVQITTSGWDLDAYLILMNIIHSQLHELPRELSLDLLAKVAVLADYYECQTLVQYFAERWIEHLKVNLPTTYSRDTVLWIWVSWIFRQSTEFQKTTFIAISQGSDTITNLGLPIPETVLYKVNSHRTNAILTIISTLNKLRDDLLNGIHGCSFECSSIMLGALTKHMHANALLSPEPRYPYKGLNYNGLLETVRNFKSPLLYTIQGYSGYGNQHKCRASSFSSLIIIQEDTVQALSLSSHALQLSP
ncbi:hypothetical protein BDV38DRAFT_271073 [Aspergillus pseudotamarii]|uniref:BTB domain-containing protein n=1 Tax=Aspergillus pseudotamarii TaxID=132259 RepID=A0A5N6SSZ7_ASPPS|nr:uncharacterized protein BDV38DRAFT_271073 [Aspergillus pseudotamarii]KAE8137765.1 hypothetical protein BDV38DRAFT_271073 [Aspergillus pseudotamarii]